MFREHKIYFVITIWVNLRASAANDYVETHKRTRLEDALIDFCQQVLPQEQKFHYGVMFRRQKRNKIRMTVTVKKNTTKTRKANSEEVAVALEEQIRRRAYELYEQRGREDGHETEDWLQAETDLAREKIKPVAGEEAVKNPKPPVIKTAKKKAKQVRQVEI